MSKTTIPKLEPGESVELQLKVLVIDYEAMIKRCSKWWHLWHPIVWRNATEEDFKPLKKNKSGKDGGDE